MCNTPGCGGRTFGDEPLCYGCREDLIRPLTEAARTDHPEFNRSQTLRHFHELLKEDS